MQEAKSLRRFDVALTVGAAWMVGGVYVDGWGHQGGAVESFFTVWHLPLYSGFAVLLGILIGYPLRRRRQGITPAVPKGSGAAFAGAFVFLGGGVADMFWHEIFGLEMDVEAFISPPHMSLVAGGALMVLGPFAALRHRPAPSGWREALPAVLSVSFVVALLQFFTEYGNALLLPVPAGPKLVSAGPLGAAGFEIQPEVGISFTLAAIVTQTLLVTGAIVALIGRLRPPVGAVTVVLSLGIGPAIFINHTFNLLPVVVVAGIVADAIIYFVPDERRPLWVLTTAVPMTLTGGWLVFLQLTHGLVWSTHLITGSVVTAGAAGLAIGFIATAARSGLAVRPAGTTATAR